MSGGVIFFGDPRGNWSPLLRACADERPDGVIIVGDCDLAGPLRRQIRTVFDAGVRVRWIPGNHDTDKVEFHDNLWGDDPGGNLHAQWAQVGHLIVVGLGGVYEERIWYPRFEDSPPVYARRHDYLRQILRANRWRGDLPLRDRDTIFPEDVEALRGLHADVLVNHEAPSCHRHGFVGIDRAAELCRASLLVHGHHHESYHAVLPSGI